MTREEIAALVAKHHGWESFGTGRELDAYMAVVGPVEKERERLFFLSNDLRDRHANALFREQHLLREIARLKGLA